MEKRKHVEELIRQVGNGATHKESGIFQISHILSLEC